MSLMTSISDALLQVRGLPFESYSSERLAVSCSDWLDDFAAIRYVTLKGFRVHAPN